MIIIFCIVVDRVINKKAELAVGFSFGSSAILVL